MKIGQPQAIAIVVGLMRTLGTLCGVGFVQLFGRRKSLIFSALSTTIFLLSVSLLLLVESLPVAIFNWSMIFLLVAVVFSNSLWMTVVPWILCGEWPDIKFKVVVL